MRMRASRIDSSVLPTAVGPVKTTALGSPCLLLLPAVSAAAAAAAAAVRDNSLVVPCLHQTIVGCVSAFRRSFVNVFNENSTMIVQCCRSFQSSLSCRSLSLSLSLSLFLTGEHAKHDGKPLPQGGKPNKSSRTRPDLDNIGHHVPKTGRHYCHGHDCRRGAR